MTNVNPTQNLLLRPAETAVGLRIRLLGPVAIVNGGASVALASKKARALLGYLTMREGAPISRNVLSSLLWGERSDSQARASLRQTLSELRTALGGSALKAILANQETVTWVTGSASIDAKIIEIAAKSEIEEVLRGAAEMLGGDLMEGLAIGEAGFEQWLAAERERFRLLACTIHTRLMDRAALSGRLEDALTHGLKLLAIDPLQEHVHRGLMRIYAAQGRHDAALAQYERCEQELLTQLAVRPDAETEGLARSIRASRRDGAIRPKRTPSPYVEPDRGALPAKPSIAVLPFQNMSDDPEQEFFVDGLTEDIIAALSRISALWVIARASTFTYKGKPTDAKQVARELNVRYVMDGSVRRTGDRLRVTAQLVDAETGYQVWAERYDRPLIDLFDIQDEITRSVAASTETQVLFAERLVAELRPSLDFKAHDLVARAWARTYDQTPEALTEASGLVEEALRIEPSNALAHRVRAAVLLSRLSLGIIPHDTETEFEAVELARTSLRFAPGDEMAYYFMSWAYAEAGRLEDAVAACERGLEINPNCTIIFSQLGSSLGPLGRPQEAIEACRLALRLNPRDPSNFWRHSSIAIAHFVAGDYEEALHEAERVARSRPLLQSGIIWAASAAALEKTDEAKMAVEYCLAERPRLTVGRVVPDVLLRFARVQDHERLLALLRKAGLPG